MNTNFVITKADVEYIHTWFFNTFRKVFKGLSEDIQHTFERYTLSFKKSEASEFTIKVDGSTIFEFTLNDMSDVFTVCDKLDELVGTEIEYYTDNEEDDDDEEEDDDDDDAYDEDSCDSCDCCVRGWSKENEFGRCECECWCSKLLRDCKYTCAEFKKHCDGFKKVDA